MHYAVDPDTIQSHVPLPLDLWKGRAVVSLVAFTMNRLRLARWPVLDWTFLPIRTTRFLNLRTYVQNDGPKGIFFLKEYVSSLLSIPMGT